MISLDNGDLEAHAYLATQLDRITLNSVIDSINSEYEEIKANISSKERANYQKLLNIYSEELMSRYSSNTTYSSNQVH